MRLCDSGQHLKYAVLSKSSDNFIVQRGCAITEPSKVRKSDKTGKNMVLRARRVCFEKE